MGKCKQRLIAKAKNCRSQMFFTREEALSSVLDNLSKNPSSQEAKEMITLFGLTAEELAEAGASYELLRSLDILLFSY